MWLFIHLLDTSSWLHCFYYKERDLIKIRSQTIIQHYDQFDWKETVKKKKKVC